MSDSNTAPAPAKSHPQLHKYLHSTPVTAISPPLSSLILLNTELSIHQALQKLAQNGISAAPVLNGDGVAVGMCSVLDIVVYVLHSLEQEESQQGTESSPTENNTESGAQQLHHQPPASGSTPPRQHSPNVFEMMAKGSKFSRQKLGDLMNHQTKIDSYIVISEDRMLSDVMHHFSDGIHRCPIVSNDEHKKLKSVLTQSAIVKHLAAQQGLFADYGEIPIKELTIGSTPVITAQMTDETLRIFKRMVKKRVAGVAVLDEQGALLGNISARDLATCEANNLYSMMHQDARLFIQKMRSQYINIANPAIAVSETTPLKLVLLKLAGNGIHRIYVCDKDQKPVRVISLRDIIEFASEIAKKHGQPQQ